MCKISSISNQEHSSDALLHACTVGLNININYIAWQQPWNRVNKQNTHLKATGMVTVHPMLQSSRVQVRVNGLGCLQDSTGRCQSFGMKQIASNCQGIQCPGTWLWHHQTNTLNVFLGMRPINSHCHWCSFYFPQVSQFLIFTVPHGTAICT